jgi:hypothetical protein
MRGIVAAGAVWRAFAFAPRVVPDKILVNRP